jgi:carboxyl-terminal processing protease
VRHDETDNQQTIQPGQPSPAETGVPRNMNAPAFRTAAGRVFYGGGGITPDIEARPLTATPVRARINEAAFYFTRELAAGSMPGFESYRIEKTLFDRDPRSSDFPITDRVVEAFRNFVRKDSSRHLTDAQIDSELEYAKLRLRVEIITAAFGADEGQRVLLESDPQTLRALGMLPEAKRLAESVRNGTPISLNIKTTPRLSDFFFSPEFEAEEIVI